MALTCTSESVKHVPWLSMMEWHRVYKQIYSGNFEDQSNAYKSLLAWKVRMSKLPVGVDCTLSIIQVCLRDREWTPKICQGELPIHYENDLCLMYSTTIMRFLNHISNVGNTKQTSLFQIAKQLKIPEWIVNLRHDAAHGHVLPSIDVLRIAVNILLTWLHEEYWIAEAKVMNEYYTRNIELLELDELAEIQIFTDLIELWIAVNLYIEAGYNLVVDIPDIQLQEALEDLRKYVLSLPIETFDAESADVKSTTVRRNIKNHKSYSLAAAKYILLQEISKYLGKSKLLLKKDAIFNVLCNNVAFLPTAEVLSIFRAGDNSKSILVENQLPPNMIKFWHDILLLLYQKKLLEPLIFKLLELVEDERKADEKRLLASLWISSFIYGFIKLCITHHICQELESKFEGSCKQLSMRIVNRKIKEEIDKAYPYLQDSICWNIFSTVPHFLTEMNFIFRLIHKINKFSNKFLPLLLNFVTPKIDKCKKQHLLNMIEIYAADVHINEWKSNDSTKKIYTIDDIHEIHKQSTLILDTVYTNDKNDACWKQIFGINQINCSSFWKIASDNYSWVGCPIGILPWQIDSVDLLEPLQITSNNNMPRKKSKIIPGIVDSKSLKMQSQINWSNVLRGNKKLKRKEENDDIDIIMDRAIQIAKTKK